MSDTNTTRDVVFISKATPGDDEFALWIAPKLEAAGYKVFTDIRSLQAGDRWRKVITDTLQNRAIKMLLCCRDATLAREGVQEEIGIASDLTKELNDPKFILPLRLEPYKKVFGIGELQYTDFVRGWAEGLSKILTALKIAKVPCNPNQNIINPQWEQFQRRNAKPILNEPERLTSNWLRVSETPDELRYFEPSGALDADTLKKVLSKSRYPYSVNSNGFFSFATLAEVHELFPGLGRFKIKQTMNLMDFIREGSKELEMRGQDASNIVNSMFRQAWNE